MTAVYRAYDEDGRLLYIGRSEQLPRRFKAHSRTKPWWNDVARIDAQFYPSHWDAVRAEYDAVQAELPLHNVRTQGTHERHCRVCGGRIAPRDLALYHGATEHAKCTSRT